MAQNLRNLEKMGRPELSLNQLRAPCVRNERLGVERVDWGVAGVVWSPFKALGARHFFETAESKMPISACTEALRGSRSKNYI